MSLITPLHTLRLASETLGFETLGSEPLATETLTTVRLGMPQLAPGGLSESWLLKHLGDLHWQLLTQQLGRPAGGIADRDGSRVYAAFRTVRIIGARLDAAREDEALTIASSLWRRSRTRMLSRHVLRTSAGDMGTVTLLSVFIRREGAGNRKVTRVEIGGLAHLPAWAEEEAEPATPAGAPARTGRYLFTPCPGEDFNGAGFLYFPAYVSIAERAAFALDPAHVAHATTTARAVAYHGNVDVGDSIHVATAEHAAEDGILLTAELRRTRDMALLARMVTHKRAIR